MSVTNLDRIYIDIKPDHQDMLPRVIRNKVDALRIAHMVACPAYKGSIHVYLVRSAFPLPFLRVPHSSCCNAKMYRISYEDGSALKELVYCGSCGIRK